MQASQNDSSDGKVNALNLRSRQKPKVSYSRSGKEVIRIPSWTDVGIGVFLIAIAVAIIITSICVIPAIGRSIDRVSDPNTVNCGVQYNTKSGDLGVGFTTIHRTNAKDHPAAATADGQNDK